MLTPGEYVIRKSSVGKIGVDNLAAMNSGGVKGYNSGGDILKTTKLAVVSSDPFNATKWSDTDAITSQAVGEQKPSNAWKGPQGTGAKKLLGGEFSPGTPEYNAALDSIKQQMGSSKKFKFTSEGLSSSVSTKFDEALDQGIITGINTAVKQLGTLVGAPGKLKQKVDGSALVNAGLKGSVFEEVLSSFNGAPTSNLVDETAPFDFPDGVKGPLKKIYPTASQAQMADAKLVAAAQL
jgi:hypothetical protein